MFAEANHSIIFLPSTNAVVGSMTFNNFGLPMENVIIAMKTMFKSKNLFVFKSDRSGFVCRFLFFKSGGTTERIEKIERVSHFDIK